MLSGEVINEEIKDPGGVRVNTAVDVFFLLKGVVYGPR